MATEHFHESDQKTDNARLYVREGIPGSKGQAYFGYDEGVTLLKHFMN